VSLDYRFQIIPCVAVLPGVRWVSSKKAISGAKYIGRSCEAFIWAILRISLSPHQRWWGGGEKVVVAVGHVCDFSGAL